MSGVVLLALQDIVAACRFDCNHLTPRVMRALERAAPVADGQTGKPVSEEDWPPGAKEDLDPPAMNAQLEGDADSPAFVRCEDALYRVLADNQIGRHHNSRVGQFRAKHED